MVAVRPPARLAPGHVQRLAARVRTRDAVLIPFLTGGTDTAWSGAAMQLSVQAAQWSGAEHGYGRLRQRRVTVFAHGRGHAARPRSAQLWLPAADGGLAAAEPDTVIELAHRRGTAS